MTDFEQMLVESVNRLQDKIEAVGKGVCDVNSRLTDFKSDVSEELTELKVAMARIEERQKREPDEPSVPSVPSHKGRNAVAFTISLAGVGAGVWQVIKALSG